MDNWIQYLIDTALAIVGILIGRYWGQHDMKRKKDQELIEKIRQKLPSDSETMIYLLNKHDFRAPFNRNLFNPIYDLVRLFEQPDCYFLDKKMEKMRSKLKKELDNFIEIEKINIFTSNDDPDYYTIASTKEIATGIMASKQAQGESPDSQECWEEGKKQFEETGENLNDAASKLFKAYNNLIAEAHKTILPVK